MNNKLLEYERMFEYPQRIETWNKKIDYVMFIDENGNTGKVQDILNKVINKIEIKNDEKYFTITGVIFEKTNYYAMRNNIKKLKEKHWKNGIYYDTKINKDKYVCLHSREIRNHTGAFNDKLINYSNFIKDLSNVLENINCKIISVTIDLEKYVLKGNINPIYEKAFDLLLERYVYATKNHKKGIIMFESRGKNEDKDLLKHINNIINITGTTHIASNELKSKIVGVYFNPKWYQDYSSTYSGLEVADLFSYPIHATIKHKKKHPSFISIEKKIDRYPNYLNKGIKLFP